MSPGNRDLSTCSAKWKIALCGVSGLAQSRRPCASIIERLIDRPIPMPPGLVVKTALNSWASRCAAMILHFPLLYRTNDGAFVMQPSRDSLNYLGGGW